MTTAPLVWAYIDPGTVQNVFSGLAPYLAALGAAAFVRKPFNREVLLAALEAQVDSRKPD